MIRIINCTTQKGGEHKPKMTNEEFEQLIERYEKLVFTICYQMVRDFHEAQNLAQDTFFSAYQHIDSCPAESYKPWLARIATNKAKDYLKSAYMRRVIVSDDEKFSNIPAENSPDEIYIESETEQNIRDKIEALKEPYLKVSTMYFIEDKNVEEISKLLGRPKKTVQTQIYRAKNLLQQLIKEERQT
ncbi:RNA polymerase sigma-70 factor (ECF subfamily) [Hydrogenoanaerobacterium saccharovorans]|uniref:RNA polymerase sigma-70 factor, ECF subfamily n=1 Tax=Hydrogenoanaerobacterium saccharovorans TaxID=474960 RepID=A0A1H7ZS04_9FIRM|nr:sigma-70 family RNA polymerase sigma factor [Hydrogenoanaerobacterium saccharovorans]RPF48469.1 RNA polymerase sigma-70 factor (ECF subfamily) [Hydrogenoanaerobacterium saccharovorans]SEM60328.1 RNA polymerase sigma-70 factor, ECF subfamily [Hydrogenoanaerobacterium saccharovorans]